MARSGLGVALLAGWLVEADLRARWLVSLLPDFETPPAPIHALMPPARHVPPRVRAFVDFLAERLAPAFKAEVEPPPLSEGPPGDLLRSWFGWYFAPVSSGAIQFD
jgi:hypothetical protein